MNFIMSHPQYDNKIVVNVIYGSPTQKLGSWVACDDKTGNQLTSGLYNKDTMDDLKAWIYYCLTKQITG